MTKLNKNIELSQFRVANIINNWKAVDNSELSFDISVIESAIEFIINNTEDEADAELASFELLKGLSSIKEKLAAFRDVDNDVENLNEE